VHIDTLSPIPVLGRYGTRGHKGTLNDLIHLLKKAPEELDSREERTHPLTMNRIGHSLFEVLHSCNFLHQVDLILPIPADAERYSTRGYSQQGEIARTLSAYSAIPMYTNVLRKIRPTRSIHTLSSVAERESELVGSMSVPPDKRFLLETQVVLLIDDVVTYGTHFKEARKVLLEAGVQRVFAAAVAAACEYIPFNTHDLK
jgi:predicted amidophosphoribosyltransferase